MRRRLLFILFLGVVGLVNAGAWLSYGDDGKILFSTDQELWPGMDWCIGMSGSSPLFSIEDNPISGPFGEYCVEPGERLLVYWGLPYNLGALTMTWTGDFIEFPDPATTWDTPLSSPIAPSSSENYIWRLDLLVHGPDGAVMDSLYFVPEPATMVLLALGGMMVRRLKK